MDLIDIREKAEVLKTSLLHYASQNGTAATLLRVLTPFLDVAVAGSLKAPFAWRDIPGDRTFSETDARDLAGLENAFAEFKIAITGGESLALKMLREKRR